MPKMVKTTRIHDAIHAWYAGTGTLSDIGFEMNIPANSFMEVIVEQDLCTPDYKPSELISEDLFYKSLFFILIMHERSARQNSKRQK